jgi:glycosyltransferase involved in cell wall biosynthesis
MTTPAERPRLLYVSPVVPALTGNGLAMRAGAILRALARHFQVTLLAAPLYAPYRAPVPAEIRACCARVFLENDGAALSSHDRFDVVHVFRLAALPFAASWLGDRAASLRQLDLDDVESVTRHRIAALLATNGEATAATRELAAARAARLREDDALARFDRVFVCSESDRQAVQGRGAAEVVVFPNTLPLPETTSPPPPTGGPFCLLFVGTLGYYPNQDAMHYFCAEILPRIRSAVGRPVILRIVGTGISAEMRARASLPNVEIISNVPDVAPWYRDAHVAVVPIRAGGGTRIKILEAFAQARPVVTTSIGIEGIAAENGRHALIADDPASFAASCLRLLHDPMFAREMADEAFALLSRAYSDESLARIVATLAPAPPR